MKMILYIAGVTAIITILIIFWPMPTLQPQEPSQYNRLALTALASSTVSAIPTAQSIPEYLFSDIRKVVPSEVLENAEVRVLTINPQAVKGGQSLSYTGSGFLPNGRVLITLNLLSDPKKTVEWETKADNSGNIDGKITVPEETTPGSWIVLAIDVERMYQQLQDISQGKQVELQAYMQANKITINR